MKRRSLLALILGIQFASVSLAQQPGPSPTPNPPAQQRPSKPTEDDDVVKITTNLVQVDAVVTDKSGKLVTDLKPGEVQIFEDGRQQKVSHFSYVVTGATAARSSGKLAPVDKNAPPVPTRLKPEDIRRTIAIVVDDLGLSFESTYYVRRALKKFVDEQMQPGDLVAIIRTAGGMGALQQFTSDKRQLYAAIDRVKHYPNGRGGVGTFAPMGSNAVAGRDPGPQAASDDLDRFREDVFAVGTLGAIGYVIRGLHELPGRKSIILVSDGIKIFNGGNSNRDQSSSGAKSSPTGDDRVLNALRRLTDQANRASVVIYTLDARGLQTLGLTAADNTSSSGDQPVTADQLEQQLSDRRADFFESQNGLNYLAQQTGGFFVHNTNDLGHGIQRVLEDQMGYYLIGYRPDESTFDPRTGRRKFHHLSLKVTRPGKFSVRMRNGFYGVSDEETPLTTKTPQQQLADALSSPFGSSGVHLQLTSLFGNTASGSMMRSLLHIDARDLAFSDELDGSHKAVIGILAVTFGDNGVPIDQTGQSYTISMRGETYKRALRDGFVYTVTVPIKKPGAYQLRVALRDNGSERVGSVSQFIEVPDLKKNRLALSGVVINGLDAAEFKRLATGNPPAPTPSAAAAAPNAQAGTQGAQPSGGAPVDAEAVDQAQAATSVAFRHFHTGMGLQYGFVIYNAQLDKATGQPKLSIQVRLFRDGRPVFVGKENSLNIQNPTDMKRLIAGGAILLGTDMTPDEYVLQIIVNDLLADQKHRMATQWMDFEIVK